MAAGNNVRVGDADRDAVAAQLREHYSVGRLTLDELNERLDQAFAAKTRADLNTVTRDLPTVAGAGVPGGTTGLSAGNGPSSWTGPRWQGPGGTGGSQWNGGSGASGGPGAQRRGLLSGAAFMFPAMIALWGLLIVGGLFVFGIGGGRPIGIVFILAAIAMLRRIFGRRRRVVRRGGCGRRRW